MSNKFERLSEMAQDEFGITIKSKSPTGGTFESLYCETKDSDRREKQIEEMTQDIDDACENKGCNEYRDCGKCHAEWLYELGYRKQSEVANEIFDEIKAIIDSNTYKVHVPNSPFWSTEYKIKKIISEIGELKKKYVEENIK